MAGIVGQREETSVSRHDKHTVFLEVDDLAGPNLVNRTRRHDLIRLLLVTWPKEDDHSHDHDRQEDNSDSELPHVFNLADGRPHADVPD